MYIEVCKSHHLTLGCRVGALPVHYIFVGVFVVVVVVVAGQCVLAALCRTRLVLEKV